MEIREKVWLESTLGNEVGAVCEKQIIIHSKAKRLTSVWKMGEKPLDYEQTTPSLESPDARSVSHLFCFFYSPSWSRMRQPVTASL